MRVTNSSRRLFDADPIRMEFKARIGSASTVLESAHLPDPPVDISREIRGLCVVLLHAAYENLIFSLNRALLEAAVALKIPNRRLKPELQLFAIHAELQSLRNSSDKKLWSRTGPAVVSVLREARSCTIKSDLFPDDRSFMKQTQVSAFCAAFGLPSPAPILREIWADIDSVVSRRNAVAHGRMSADEVGREYTVDELRSLLVSWRDRWLDFIDVVEQAAQAKPFYTG